MTASAMQTGDRGARRWRWRVLVAVPPAGFAAQFAIMRAWLDQNYGRAAWDAAPAGTTGIVNDMIAFYFADRVIARACVERFSCGYRTVAPQGL